MDSSFQFKLLKKDSTTKARVGEIHTPHGVIQTPAFVAVGTRATVRSLTPEDLKDTGVQLLFGNTYHLHLRPGEDLVQDFGGLGKFMRWDGPTITDSGGFQVFSFGQKKVVDFDPSNHARNLPDQEEDDALLVKINEDGVEFRSHIDGSKHFFSPEESIGIQKKLGADIILCFDECAPYPSDHAYTQKAMERTHNWAQRSLAEFKVQNEKFKVNPHQALYGIVQGGVYKDLREESAKFISSLDFDGIAVGGVSVGESKDEMRKALQWVHPFLPEQKPRHLLGIGEIDDIFAGVEYGMDTFDCVIPTRFGRYGIVFVRPEESDGKPYRVDLMRTIYAEDKRPISKYCTCYVCKKYTRAYLHHLFRVKELLAYRLASYHNMYFINHLVENIRQSILNGKFEDLKKQWL